MIEALAQAYRRALAGWTAAVCRFAWLVMAVSTIVTLGAGVYLAENIRINTDTEDMLSPDLDFRRNSEALSQAFPQFSDNLVVVIDGVTPDIADDAARALAARLRQRPGLFGRVEDPAGSDFFRRNGFLYLDLDDLYVLSDRLAEAQPFLGTLWRDPSLVGLFRMLNLAADEVLEDTSGQPAQPMEIVRVLDAIAGVAEAQAAGKFGQLSWQRLMSGDSADEGDDKADKAGANRRVLVIQPALDFASLSPAADAMDGVREAALALGLTPENGVRVRLTGSAALSHEELQSVEKGMGKAGAISLVLVIGLLTVGLRSKRLVAATLVTLVMGLIWTAAFAILALGTLNLISVAFAVLFIGLSVDFGIHYGLRYQEALGRGEGHAQALGEAANRVGGALTLCAVSAAIAFYSFLPTDYLGLAELGLIAGTGMFIALFANMTVLPAMLTVMPHPRSGGRKPHSFAPLRPLFRSFLGRNSGAVCWLALAAGIGSALLLPKAAFDFDPLNLKDPETESVAALFDLMADNRNSPYTVTVLSRDLDTAVGLAERLEALAEVDGTATLADYVPADQDEKLEVISSMALFLAPAFADSGAIAPPSAEERRAAFRTFREKLRAVAALAGDGLEKKAALRLSRALKGIEGDDAVAEFEKRLLTALPGRLEALDQALRAAPVSLETLPAAITDDQVAADGRAKVEVFPKQDLRDRRALTRFVAAVRTVAADATGSSVVILEAGNTIVRAFWQAGVISVAMISLVLIVVLRRLLDAVLVFAPLALAALLTVAASVLFNLPFNFANVIVLPLLFGLGVAGGIHLVVRANEETGETHAGGVMETSTPRAVLFSALTTIGSFGSIALSSHPGTSSMGLLLTIAIALSLGCTLIVLPALMNVLPAAKTGKPVP